MGWRGSAQSLGGAAWPLIGGALGGLSWHLPFAVYMLTIPIGVIAIVVLRESPALRRRDLSPTASGDSRRVRHIPGGPVSSRPGACGRDNRLRLRSDTGSFVVPSDRHDRRCAVVYSARVPVFRDQQPHDRRIRVSVRDRERTDDALSHGLAGECRAPFLSPIPFAPIMVLLGLRGVFLIGAGVGAAWVLLLYGASGRLARRRRARAWPRNVPARPDVAQPGFLHKRSEVAGLARAASSGFQESLAL